MNYDVDAEIKKIISRIFPPDGTDRQIFEKVFSALAKYQKNFLNDLETRIEEEKKTPDFDKDFEIAVKLVRRGDAESKRGFFSMDVGSSFVFPDGADLPSEKNSFFIVANYEEIKNFCEPKKFRGQLVTADGTTKNFFYSLQRHDRFVRHEKILSEVAELYKIRRPVIFSPYARKAVDIKILDCERADFENLRDLNLRTAENKLTEIMETVEGYTSNLKTSCETRCEGMSSMSNMTSSILLPVSINPVAKIVRLPPSSIFLAAPKNLFGL